MAWNAHLERFFSAGCVGVFVDRYHLDEIQDRSPRQLQALYEMGFEISDFGVLNVD
jgi:hypothetical protein